MQHLYITFIHRSSVFDGQTHYSVQYVLDFTVWFKYTLSLCTALPQSLSELRKKLNLTGSYWRQGELSAFYQYLKWE